MHFHTEFEMSSECDGVAQGTGASHPNPLHIRYLHVTATAPCYFYVKVGSCPGHVGKPSGLRTTPREKSCSGPNMHSQKQCLSKSFACTLFACHGNFAVLFLLESRQASWPRGETKWLKDDAA